MKDLIVYYSLDGNTRTAAKQLSEKIDADLLELKTVKQLPKGTMKFFVGGMKAAFGMTEKVKPYDVDLKKYDRIIVGTPVWAGKCATAINTFLKKSDCQDLIKAVFTLSGGGDNDKCISALAKKLPNLTLNVALADKNNPASSENEEKLNRFAERLTNG